MVPQFPTRAPITRPPSIPSYRRRLRLETEAALARQHTYSSQKNIPKAQVHMQLRRFGRYCHPTPPGSAISRDHSHLPTPIPPLTPYLVFLSPSLTLGSHWRMVRALVMSGLRCFGSSGVFGVRMTSAEGFTTARTVSASSSIVNSPETRKQTLRIPRSSIQNIVHACEASFEISYSIYRPS